MKGQVIGRTIVNAEQCGDEYALVLDNGRRIYLDDVECEVLIKVDLKVGCGQ